MGGAGWGGVKMIRAVLIWERRRRKKDETYNLPMGRAGEG